MDCSARGAPVLNFENPCPDQVFERVGLTGALITLIGANLLAGLSDFSRRHRPEQYLISSHARSHFLRHVNGRPQVRQFLVGRVA